MKEIGFEKGLYDARLTGGEGGEGGGGCKANWAMLNRSYGNHTFQSMCLSYLDIIFFDTGFSEPD